MIAPNCLGDKRAPSAVQAAGPHPRPHARHQRVAGLEVADRGGVGGGHGLSEPTRPEKGIPDTKGKTGSGRAARKTVETAIWTRE